MTSSIKKLTRHINQLVLWLNENPKTRIPELEKQRIEKILNKILESGEVSGSEFSQLMTHSDEEKYVNCRVVEQHSI